ncbi:MAG: hypothetical protein WDZ76_04290 [Pseudohongiellaceae bacterium]
MIELTGDIPFLWRLSAESNDGFCAVAMVVPYQVDDNKKDLTIETSVVSLSSDSTRSEQDEMLEWNQEDINLFLRLVNQTQYSRNLPVNDTVRIDLTDPSIIEIIHVVAAAGFGMAFASCGALRASNGRYPTHLCEVGSFASLNAVSGFVRCVVVDVEEEDVVCVLLDDIDIRSGNEYDRLSRHDLLMVKREDVLHPEFADHNQRPDSARLH